MIDDLYEGRSVGVMPPHARVGTDPARALHSGESTVSSRSPFRGPRHRYYDAMFPSWEFYRQSYEGGSEYLRNNLFKHTKEPADSYRERLARSVVLNHSTVVADTYSGLLYKHQVSRSADGLSATAQDVLSELWGNADLLGSDMQEVMKGASIWAQVYGIQHILVDRWEPDSEPLTRAQERESGRRPYLRQVEPQDLVDWSMDWRGRLRWAAIREHHEDEAEYGARDEDGDGTSERVRVWTPSEWALYAVHAADEESEEPTLEELERGEHPCGEVPIVSVRLGPPVKRTPLARSLIRDIAPHQRRAVNLLSLIDEQLYQNVFNIMMLPESTFERLSSVDWSVAGSIPVAEDSRFVPAYLSPNIDTVTVIRSEIAEAERAIRFASGLGRKNEDSRVAQSGLALSYQNVDKQALIDAMAGTMADAEIRISELALRWMQVSFDAIERPQYVVDIEPDELEGELKNALGFLAVVDTPEAQAEAKAQVTRTYFGTRLSDSRRIDELVDRVRNAEPAQPPEALARNFSI